MMIRVLRGFGSVSAFAALGFVGVLGAGALTGGCSSGPDLTSEEAFCSALAQSNCNAQVVQSCYMPSSETASADAAECVSLASSAERCNPGNFPYHAQFAQGCLDAQAALYAGAPTLDPTLLAASISACNAVFNNGRETGAACKADTDCDVGNGLVCVVRTTGGTCQVPVATMPGQLCNQPSAQCADGYYCAQLQSGGQSVCAPDPTGGGECGTGIPCATGFYCETGANGSGQCVGQLGDSVACTSDAQCKGGFCDATATNTSVCAGAPAPLTFATPACTNTFAP